MITNLVNGRIYIGKTNSKKRFTQHKYVAKSRLKTDYSRLHRAIRKYGKNNFTYHIMAEYDDETTAYEMEEWYVRFYHSNNRIIGYNLDSGGKGGSRRSDITKERIRKARIGEKNPFYGHRHSDETKALMRAKSGKGERNNAAKLTTTKVQEIREKFSTGSYTKARLAKEYEVTDVLIGKVIRREIWQNEDTTRRLGMLDSIR